MWKGQKISKLKSINIINIIWILNITESWLEDFIYSCNKRTKQDVGHFTNATIMVAEIKSL